MLTNDLNLIIKNLKADKIVALPTDTVYGFFVRIGKINQEKVNLFKGRTSNQPVQVFFPNFEAIKTSSQLSAFQMKQLHKFLPGKYSLLVPASVNFKKRYLPPSQNNILVRLISEINNPELANILEACGPLLATSANFTKQKPLIHPKEISDTFKIVTLNKEMGKKTGIPSQIVSLLDDKVSILR